MEGTTLHQTELCFRTTRIDHVLLKLKIIWPADTVHVLVAVNNQIGQLLSIFIWTKRDVNKLTWRGWSKSETYSVQVYGLKLDSTSGLERRDRQGITLYSVEAVKKFIIHQSLILSPDSTKTEVADLRVAFGMERIMDSLGQQINFDIEPQHQPPMDHRLKLTLLSGSTAGLYIIYNEKTKKEYLMMSSVYSNAGYDSIPLLPIQHSRTVYKVCAFALNGFEKYMFGTSYTSCGKTRVLTIKTCKYIWKYNR